jgi:hypothetical protein
VVQVGKGGAPDVGEGEAAVQQVLDGLGHAQSEQRGIRCGRRRQNSYPIFCEKEQTKLYPAFCAKEQTNLYPVFFEKEVVRLERVLWAWSYFCMYLERQGKRAESYMYVQRD